MDLDLCSMGANDPEETFGHGFKLPITGYWQSGTIDPLRSPHYLIHQWQQYAYFRSL